MFNVEQIDGIADLYPSPADDTAPPAFERIEQADRFVSATGAIIRHGGSRAFYQPAAATVHIPPAETIRDPPAYGQREQWPINLAYRQSRELAVWGLILGIERGWFAYDRQGYLHWSQAGRDRYAAGNRPIVIDSVTGQSGFAF